MVEPTSLATILRDEDVLLDSPLGTKAALLAAAAEHLGRSTGVASDILLKALTDREKLGSTAIGRGTAVPHARMDGLTTPAAVFFRLVQPIPFQASDNNPVDLVFVVVWPSDKRSGLLVTLGALSRTLRAESLLQEIRRTSSPAKIRQLLGQSPPQATPSLPAS